MLILSSWSALPCSLTLNIAQSEDPLLGLNEHRSMKFGRRRQTRIGGAEVSIRQLLGMAKCFVSHPYSNTLMKQNGFQGLSVSQGAFYDR